MRSLLVIIVSALFALGVVMIFSTSSAEVLDHDLSRSTHQALLKQIYYACGGLLLAYAVVKVGYNNYVRFSPYALAFFTFLLILVLIPGVGKIVNGSRRWIGFAGLSLQPSEFVKYILPAFLIYRISLFTTTPTLKEFLQLMGIAAIPILLIMVEPNNGTAAVIALSAMVICLLTQIPPKYWALPLLIFAVVGGLFASQLPYVSARLKVYLHPELDLKGKGHQPYQAKIAAGSGQFFGKGPGNSLQKLSYLPEAQNDYIAAIYAEEFGFVGLFALICLYASLGGVGFSIAMNARDQAGCYLACVVTFLICFQAFMNLGVVSGLLPSTGLNLPFFSQGGSSLMVNTAAIGLLWSVASREETNPSTV